MTPSLLLIWLLSTGAGAPDSLVGEVASAPAEGERRVVVKKDRGGEQIVTFSESTRFVLVRPGATRLTEGTAAGPGDVQTGDRVLCRGREATPGAPWTASLVAVMKRADLDERHTREREDWKRRGASGVVVALDPEVRAITLRVAGSRTPLAVVTGPRTLFRRYAPGSLRFADARPSSFAELALGDQLRVLGDRDGEHPRVQAEQIVAGAYRVVRGVLAEVDAVGNVVSVRETAPRDGGPRNRAGLVRVSLGRDALVRRLPPPLVMRLLRAADDTERPAGPRAVDPDELLERLPPIGLPDLRGGEEVAALGPRTPEPDSLMAIKLVVWTVGTSPESRARGRGNGIEDSADPFADLLGFGGDAPW